MQVGLNVVQGAKLRGAHPIIAVDIEGSKESIARQFGASHFINNSAEDPVPKIMEYAETTESDTIQTRKIALKLACFQ